MDTMELLAVAVSWAARDVYYFSLHHNPQLHHLEDSLGPEALPCPYLGLE